jgi:hypothetical protein
MAISLGFVSLFDFPTFSGWVTFVLASIIPMEIMMGVTWGANLPGFAGSLVLANVLGSQPVRCFAEVLGKLGDRTQVNPNSSGREVLQL